MDYRMEKLRHCIIGWINYFGVADISRLTKELDKWIRRRIRMCIWKQWQKIKTRYDNLENLGTNEQKA